MWNTQLRFWPQDVLSEQEAPCPPHPSLLIGLLFFSCQEKGSLWGNDFIIFLFVPERQSLVCLKYWTPFSCGKNESRNTKNTQNNINGINKQTVTFLKSPVTAPRLISIHTQLLVVFLQRQVSWACSLSLALWSSWQWWCTHSHECSKEAFGLRLSSLGAVGGERISHLKKQSWNKQLN